VIKALWRRDEASIYGCGREGEAALQAEDGLEEALRAHGGVEAFEPAQFLLGLAGERFLSLEGFLDCAQDAARAPRKRVEAGTALDLERLEGERRNAKSSA